LDPSKLSGYSAVLIDEYTMLPVPHMALLVRAQKKYGFKVICFGDERQCVSIGEFVSFHTNPLFLEMCGNVVVSLKYKENYARYDKAMYNALCEFDRTSKLSDAWFQELPLTYTHLCYSNTKRQALNKECLDRWVKEHNATLIDVGGMKVCVGLAMTVYYENDKEAGFFKTQDWIVEGVADGKVHLTRGGEKRWIVAKDFKAMFDYSFAKTTHRSQGITIENKYVIWEADRMSKNTLNTALSRGTCLANVFVAGKKITKTFYPDQGGNTQIPMKDLIVKYKIGRIYRMRLAGLTYIGRTDETLVERLAGHKAHPTNSRIKALMESGHIPTIELVSEFKYVVEKVFADVETEYIEKEKQDCGDILNVIGNTPEAVKKTKEITFKENKKFPVKDDEKMKRFEAACSAQNVDMVDRRVKFSYARRDKELVRKEAENHSLSMKQKYY